jgi:hypothetical protein
MEPSCKGKHYLLYASHTFPGRFTAWCPHKKRAANCSLSDVKRSSKEAAYWLRGFLEGNVPEPPRDDSGIFLAADNPRFQFWERAAALFQTTGYWNSSERKCERCRGDILPSAVLSGGLCDACVSRGKPMARSVRRKKC